MLEFNYVFSKLPHRNNYELEYIYLDFLWQLFFARFWKYPSIRNSGYSACSTLRWVGLEGGPTNSSQVCVFVCVFVGRNVSISKDTDTHTLTQNVVDFLFIHIYIYILKVLYWFIWNSFDAILCTAATFETQDLSDSVSSEDCPLLLPLDEALRCPLILYPSLPRILISIPPNLYTLKVSF